MSEPAIFIVTASCVILSLTIFLSNDVRLNRWLFQLVQFLFIIQITCYVIRIGSLPFAKTPYLGRWLFNGYIIPYSAFTGTFLSFLILTASTTKRIQATNHLLAEKKAALANILKLSAATVFLYSALGSLVSYHRSLQFFTTSGYNAPFFIFIIIVEFTCAFALLSKRTAFWAAMILIVDMIGAVSTHYHNYFARHLPEPLSNSIPALITLTVLIGIAYFCTRAEKACSAPCN